MHDSGMSARRYNEAMVGLEKTTRHGRQAGIGIESNHCSMHRHSRDPVAVGGDKRDGGALEALGDVGEPVEELGLHDEPEVLLLVPLAVVAQLLGELLLEVLLLVQHELGVRHQEVVRLGPLLLCPGAPPEMKTEFHERARATGRVERDRKRTIIHTCSGGSGEPCWSASTATARRTPLKRRGG